MEKFIRFWHGYVCVVIEGEQLERFLNLCKARGITIRKIKYTGEKKLAGIVSVDDFFKLGPLRSKTKVHIRIQKKHGMPFFFYRNKKKKAFFIGSLLCFCLLLLLSSHIWNIHVEGNQKNSTPEILAFLEEQGIVHGIAKRDVNCYSIADMIRRQYPDITWVSARMEGTRLLLTIQEGEILEELPEEQEPCDLAAEVEGEIVQMITRSGTPLMKIGDICKKGDILVLGRLDVKNDSQEVVRYEYVHADADVYVRHDLAYYQEFSMEYEAQIPTEDPANTWYLRIGNLLAGADTQAREGCTTAVTEYPWRVTENFVLPVALGKVTRTPYRTARLTYTREQAKALAIQTLQRYEKKIIQKGLQISENNVKIEISDTACVSRGTLTVIEKTGADVPVTRQEQALPKTG